VTQTKPAPLALIGTGFAVGLPTLTNFQFRDHIPWSACRICGLVYQNPDALKRIEWAQKHAHTHTDTEHRQFQLSGRQFTPEAANRLAAFGVIPILDLVLDDEVADALKESHPVPRDDAEGVT
jgi:hypothetical protein